MAHVELAREPIAAGGEGGDALIVNRAGTNALLGGSGNDLFVFKESASIVKSDGSFNFGQQVISGGSGFTRGRSL